MQMTGTCVTVRLVHVSQSITTHSFECVRMSDTENTHLYSFVWLQSHATSHENQKLFVVFGKQIQTHQPLKP